VLRLHGRKILESYKNLAKLNGMKPLYLLGKMSGELWDAIFFVRTKLKSVVKRGFLCLGI